MMWVCVYVCVCARTRTSVRMSVCVCVCAYMWKFLLIFFLAWRKFLELKVCLWDVDTVLPGKVLKILCSEVECGKFWQLVGHHNMGVQIHSVLTLICPFPVLSMNLQAPVSKLALQRISLQTWCHISNSKMGHFTVPKYCFSTYD